MLPPSVVFDDPVIGIQELSTPKTVAEARNIPFSRVLSETFVASYAETTHKITEGYGNSAGI